MPGVDCVPAEVNMRGSSEKCPTVESSRNCDASALLSATSNLQQHTHTHVFSDNCLGTQHPALTPATDNCLGTQHPALTPATDNCLGTQHPALIPAGSRGRAGTHDFSTDRPIAHRHRHSTRNGTSSPYFSSRLSRFRQMRSGRNFAIRV